MTPMFFVQAVTGVTHFPTALRVRKFNVFCLWLCVIDICFFSIGRAVRKCVTCDTSVTAEALGGTTSQAQMGVLSVLSVLSDGWNPASV
jgi:hypothetical protein